MVVLYNYPKFNCVDEESKLISQEVKEIDHDLQPAEHTLTWQTEHIWNYIEGLKKKVFKLIVERGRRVVLLEGVLTPR